MLEIEITGEHRHSEGVVVAWDTTYNGQTLSAMKINFGANMSRADIRQRIAEISEGRAALIDNPPIPADLSGDVGVRLPVDGFKKAVPLDAKKALKIAEIENQVLDFIARKGDGNSRYNLQHQIATLASLVSALEKDKNASLSTEEKQALKDKRNRAAQTWAWMEGVFTAQMQAQAAVAAMTDAAEVEAYQLDLTPFELTDPDVYLAEIWDKLEVEA